MDVAAPVSPDQEPAQLQDRIPADLEPPPHAHAKDRVDEPGALEDDPPDSTTEGEAHELLAAACDFCGSDGPALIKMRGTHGAFWMCGACPLKLGGGA